MEHHCLLGVATASWLLSHPHVAFFNYALFYFFTLQLGGFLKFFTSHCDIAAYSSQWFSEQIKTKVSHKRRPASPTRCLHPLSPRRTASLNASSSLHIQCVPTMVHLCSTKLNVFFIKTHFSQERLPGSPNRLDLPQLNSFCNSSQLL